MITKEKLIKMFLLAKCNSNKRIQQMFQTPQEYQVKHRVLWLLWTRLRGRVTKPARFHKVHPNEAHTELHSIRRKFMNWDIPKIMSLLPDPESLKNCDPKNTD